MPESNLDNLGTIPRRAIVAAPLIGLLTFATMLAASMQLDLPVRDPDGAVLGSPLVLIAVVMVVFIALDVVPRALFRSRKALGRFGATAKGIFQDRWTLKRLAIVVAALLGFYLTYVGYRNLKSFLPFATHANHDQSLFQLDRDLSFGHDPGTLLHDLLGTGLAAYVLSVVYVFFLMFVPLSLGAAVVWQRRLHGGLWYVASMNICWVLGTISYYALPSLGPAFIEPQLYAGLPNTGVTALQQALLEHRSEVIASPHAADGVQSIAAFASLHVAIVLMAALIATLLVVRRAIRVSLWVFLALTCLATIYFGWHYLVDDVAGAAIGIIAVVLGAAATGHRLRPSGARRPSLVESGMGRLVGGAGHGPAMIGGSVMPRDTTVDPASE
ncbi:MAG: hypothetical protein QOG63_1866 [Thermoleophilaceae bacterium]|nr:hypothetical protein [Thermoleophilaceae bacterium]